MIINGLKGIKFIKNNKKMKLSDLSEDIQFMSTTKKQMYSTMVPATTPRRRYFEVGQSASLKKSVLERSIDIQPPHLAATFTKQLKRQVKTPNLPQIKSRKGIMMEEWLNQNLQKDGGEISSSKEPLKTLKKYGLDKATLRNLRLSHETIDKLYKGLFVYTEGIKNAFKQMLAEASVMPREDNFLPKKYFAVFLKLLQNSAPVKSTFKVIEQTYKKQILDLKNVKIALLAQIEKHKQNTIDVQHKFQKEIQQLTSKVTTMTTDYRVMEATLQMYEMSFNEQVFLRLKFEEKINQAYSCYEQMKVKYQCMKQELTQQKQILFGNDIEHKSIKQRLESELIKNQEYQKQIQELKERLKRYQREIVIKHQEILDIKLVNRSEEEMKLSQQTALDEMIVANKLLKKQNKQASLQIQQFRKTIETQTQSIQRLKSDLSSVRDKNDDLFIKCHDTGIKIAPLQNEIHEKALKIITLTKQNVVLKAGKQVVDEQLIAKNNKIASLEKEITILQKNNAHIGRQLEKISANIIEFKDIKDKYQRLNEKLKEQIQIERKLTAERVKQLTLVSTKKVDLQFHIQSVEKQANQYEAKIFQLEKQLKVKDDLIEQKKGYARIKINEKQKEVQQKVEQIKNHKKAYQKLMNQSNQKDNEKLNKLDEISYIKKLNTSQQNQLKEQRNKINELTADNQQKQLQITSLKKQLKNKEFTISKKKKQVDSQACLLKEKIKLMKSEISQRSQYVHPMIVEDLKAQIERLYQQIQKILKNDENMRNTFEDIQQQLRQKKGEVNSNSNQLGKMTKDIDFYRKELGKIKEQKLALEGKIRDLELKIKVVNNERNKDKSEFNTVLGKKQEQIKDLSLKCKVLEGQIKMKNSSLKEALTKPPTNTKQQQTQKPCPKEVQPKSTNQTEVQTDPIPETTSTDSNQQTTLQKKRSLKNQQEHEEKAGQIGQKHTQKRVQQKEFKKALKLTYMRK